MAFYSEQMITVIEVYDEKVHCISELPQEEKGPHIWITIGNFLKKSPSSPQNTTFLAQILLLCPGDSVILGKLVVN